ncbi:glycosyltransferase family 87 protein [Paraburkholderia pallida]|uniref:DUF2029 domain-containing protein n=1 Tax=Paraburkholderia pallida TaxID=2547399 RepID=A0A4P7CR12_9BURK|nr:glycosyltransferase family 87 protein [Paraburkholderia pallida]QBQ98318.1 DUF2029 domain-containing protein [Paraburkholderia pallida]
MTPTTRAVATNASRSHRTGHWLDRRRIRLYACTVLLFYAIVALVYAYRTLWQHRPDFGTIALDYLPVWSASHLALHGQALDAYNQAVLASVERAAIAQPVGILPWLYPPTCLLITAPFALLPFRLSAIAFLFITLAMFLRAVCTIVPGRLTLLPALAFPAVAVVLVSGQNGLLTAALAGLGLIALRRRPILAGFAFGLLCVKPHLATLIPLALLCSRSWRALASMAITAITTLAFATLAFGPATLSAFVHNMGLISGYVEAGRIALARVPTFFAMARLAHLSVPVAYALQAVSAVCGALAVVRTWSRPCAFELRAATLVCASLLVSPYLFDYDLTWFGLLIAWFVRHAQTHGFRQGEREWLVALWLAPCAGIFIIGMLHVQLMPILTAFSLALLLRRVESERRNRASSISLPVELTP